MVKFKALLGSYKVKGKHYPETGTARTQLPPSKKKGTNRNPKQTHHANMSVQYRSAYTPLLYSKIGGNVFSFFALKHRVWVLVRTAHKACLRNADHKENTNISSHSILTEIDTTRTHSTETDTNNKQQRESSRNGQVNLLKHVYGAKDFSSLVISSPEPKAQM